MYLAAVFILFAGVIRGYSGFGFAVIAALCLSFIYSPFDAVAIALALDLLSSLCLVFGIKTQVNWRLLGMLSLGMLGAIPVSLFFVSVISAHELKMIIAGFSFVAGALIMLNLSLKGSELRATAIVFFILSSAASLLGLLYVNAVSVQSIQISLMLFPVAVIGNLIGKRLFNRYPDSSPKKTVAPILMGLALLIII